MIVHALLIGSLILSVLGVLQAFGVDYLANDVTTPFLPCLCIRCLRNLMELRQVSGERGFLCNTLQS